MDNFILKEEQAVPEGRDLFLTRHTRQNIFTRYHKHDYYEFFIMAEGTLTELREGTRIKMGKGDSLFIRPADSHGYPDWRREQFTFYNLVVRKSLWSDLTQLHPELPWFRLSAADSPRALSLRGQNLDFCLYSLEWILRIEHREAQRMAVLNFLGRMALQFWFSEWHEYHEEAPPWLLNIMTRLNEKFFIREGIPYLRREAAVSYEHFSRQFKKYYGLSPSDYLKKKRTGLARALLRGSDMTVAEIAAECGYENLSHFHHQFKDEYGLSPLKYRRQFDPGKSCEA